MTQMVVEGRPQAKIHYTLQPIPPKARKGGDDATRYAAHVQIRTSSLASIAEQMVREGSKYSEAEILAIMTQMMNTVAYRLTNGEAVNLGSMVRLRPAIRGTFESDHAPLEPGEHEIVVTATIGSKLRKIVQGAKAEQIDRVTMPKLSSVDVVAHASDATAPINLVVHGSALTRQQCKKASEWFVQVGMKRTVLTPVAYNADCAILIAPRENLPAAEPFTLGLRVYLNATAYTDIVYKSPLTLAP